MSSREHHLFGHERFHAAEFAVRSGEFLFSPDYELLPDDQEEVHVDIPEIDAFASIVLRVGE